MDLDCFNHERVERNRNLAFLLYIMSSLARLEFVRIGEGDWGGLYREQIGVPSGSQGNDDIEGERGGAEL
ncbi:hypothetical protein SUGI_0789340 [Cryptomeria japonica]|nr:hypothetical protein SUGI_0789340 [Cryptomeria japonica]